MQGTFPGLQTCEFGQKTHFCRLRAGLTPASETRTDAGAIDVLACLGGPAAPAPGGSSSFPSLVVCVWSAWKSRGCVKLEEAIMAQGTVKWFNSVKGFGFIRPSDGSSDVFVHVTAVERAGMSGLAEGQKVSYDLATERGKTAAVNLKAV
jgi:CspA family cold shock protein